MNFDAIFFDIDGTLLVSNELMAGGFQKGFSKFGYEISIHPWRGSGMTDYQIIRMFLADQKELSEAEQVQLAEELSVDIQKINLETLDTVRLGACPGVVSLVSALREKGIPLGLLTGNMYNMVAAKLKNAGLDPENFVYGGFGDHSPDRGVTARRALKSAEDYFGRKLDPQRCLVIGDTPRDISCARDIQAKVLAVASGEHTVDELSECHPDYLMSDLCDIQAFYRILGI